jgi:glycosyltransferase involved in cell wall biosynthesis
MPKITALIHCHASPHELARSLETLRACDEVLVINHDSNSDTEKVAREHGATIKVGVPGVSLGTYLVDAANDWIFCLKPSETLSEELEASLLEWKQQEHEPAQSFAMSLRLQQNGNWEAGGRHTRLVNRTHINWTSELPPDREDSELMPGDLLEIEMPEEQQRRSA